MSSKTLIQQDPEEALKLAFLQHAGRAAPDVPQASDSLESYGDWEGPADYVILDDASLKSSKSIVKLTAGGQPLEVHYAGNAPNGLKCGSLLRVSGLRVNRHVAPTSSDVQELTHTAYQGAVTAQAATPCSTTGLQSVAVVLVTFPGVAPPITTSAVNALFFGTGNRSVSGDGQCA